MATFHHLREVRDLLRSTGREWVEKPGRRHLLFFIDGKLVATISRGPRYSCDQTGVRNRLRQLGLLTRH